MNNAIVDFLKKLIWGFVDKFKMKNPVVFGVVATILFGIFNTISNLVLQGLLADLVLFTLPFVGKVTITKTIVALLTLLGAHTPSLPAAPSQSVGETEEP